MTYKEYLLKLKKWLFSILLVVLICGTLLLRY